MRKAFIIILLANLLSCHKTDNLSNSNETLKKQYYSKDSVYMLDWMKKQIKSHTANYEADLYDDSTKVFIDTILYNPDFKKAMFFIIEKNENKNMYSGWSEAEIKAAQEYGNLPFEGYHYNGKTYIGYRENENFIIKDFFRIEVSKYLNIKEVKARQREIFFEELSTQKDKGSEYNVDDKEFWENPYVWNALESKR